MAIKAEEIYIEVDARVDKALKDFKKVDTQTDKLIKTFKKFAGPAAIGAAVVGLYKLGKAFVDSYAIQQQAETSLKAAIMATGKQSSISMDAMEDYASSLQDVTLYGDETILSAQSVLQSLADLDQKGLQQITPHVMDFSTAMGVDLKTAMSLVGKTLGSSTNALSRYGIEIDMSGTKSQKLAELTKALTDKFGGMAKAAGSTTTGSFKQLSNATGDLKEQLGRAISDGMSPFARATIKIIEEITKWEKKNNDIKEFLDSIKNGSAKAGTSIDVLKESLKALDAEYRKKNSKTSAITEKEIKDYERQRKIIVDQIKDQEALTALKKHAAAMDQRYAKEQNAINEKKKEEAKQAVINKQKEIEVNKKLYDAIEKQKDPMQQNIDSLQKEIDYWHQFKDVPGAQKYINYLVKERNTLQEKFNEKLEETKNKINNTGNIAVKYYDWNIDQANKMIDSNKKVGDSYDGIKKKMEEYISDANTLNSSASQLVDQIYANEIQTINNTEDKKIESIKKYYNEKLSLLEKGSDAYIDMQEKETDALDKENAARDKKIKESKKKQWKWDKALNISKSIIDTISAVTEALPNIPLSIAVGILGAANTAAIVAQPMPSFATGTKFTTTGETPIVVGDNASGQERVSVEPVNGSNQGTQQTILNIDGQQFFGWMQNSINNGMLRIPRRVII